MLKGKSQSQFTKKDIIVTTMFRICMQIFFILFIIIFVFGSTNIMQEYRWIIMPLMLVNSLGVLIPMLIFPNNLYFDIDDPWIRNKDGE